jgi:hypothetical protein
MKRGQAKQRVYDILKNHPQTRDCDKTLTVFYWWKFQRSLLVHNSKDDKWYVPLSNVPKLDSEDKISRIRRKIQNTEGRFFPTQARVARKRGVNMEHWRKWAAQRNDTL